MTSPTNNKHSLVNSLLDIAYYSSNVRIKISSLIMEVTQYTKTKDCSCVRDLLRSLCSCNALTPDNFYYHKPKGHNNAGRSHAYTLLCVYNKHKVWQFNSRNGRSVSRQEHSWTQARLDMFQLVFTSRSCYVTERYSGTRFSKLFPAVAPSSHEVHSFTRRVLLRRQQPLVHR
jgi:hypothetical protein